MAKSTKIEMQRRVRAVYKQILRGKSTQEILQYCAEKYGLRTRQAMTLLARAREKIDAWQYAEIDKNRRDHRARLVEFIMRCQQSEDRTNERLALNDLM